LIEYDNLGYSLEQMLFGILMFYFIAFYGNHAGRALKRHTMCLMMCAEIYVIGMLNQK